MSVNDKSLQPIIVFKTFEVISTHSIDLVCVATGVEIIGLALFNRSLMNFFYIFSVFSIFFNVIVNPAHSRGN